MTDETERNKATIRGFFNALNTGDVPAIVASYTPDGTVRTMGRTLISGTFTRDQIEGAASLIYDNFPDGLSFEILAMTAEDDRVAIEATSSGRHISGRMYENEYHFLARLRDGKIVSYKEYCDTELITDILCGGQRPEGVA